jgi:hypothetical protein
MTGGTLTCGLPVCGVTAGAVGPHDRGRGLSPSASDQHTTVGSMPGASLASAGA